MTESASSVQEQAQPQQPSEAERHQALLEEQVRLAGREADVPPQLIHMAAIAWARWQEAAAILDRDGLVVNTSQGVTAHPAAMIERQSCATYTQLLGRMSLTATPSQRRYASNQTPRLRQVTTISDLMAMPAEVVEDHSSPMDQSSSDSVETSSDNPSDSSQDNPSTSSPSSEISSTIS
jgi:hypothetical protein